MWALCSWGCGRRPLWVRGPQPRAGLFPGATAWPRGPEPLQGLRCWLLTALGLTTLILRPLPGDPSPGITLSPRLRAQEAAGHVDVTGLTAACHRAGVEMFDKP